MKIKVTVTAADIKSGEKSSPWGCPVALAAKRAVGKRFAYDVLGVSPSDIKTYRHGIRDDRRGKVPRKVTTFIIRFDAGGDVKPFSFTVDIRRLKE